MNVNACPSETCHERNGCFAFGPLDTFKARGGKMLTFVGGNDQFIYPRGVLNYYRQMAERYQKHNDRTGFEGVQSFYRLFRAPGVGHCGAPVFSLGTTGPWPQGGADSLRRRDGGADLPDRHSADPCPDRRRRLGAPRRAARAAGGRESGT